MLMEKATEIVLAQELSEQGLNKSAIARRLGRDRETIRFWLRGIEQHGLKEFVDNNATACKMPRPSRQVDALVKLWIWQIRERDLSLIMWTRKRRGFAPFADFVVCRFLQTRWANSSPAPNAAVFDCKTLRCN